MKIVYISTYPPRLCGLATFTHDLKKAIALYQKSDESDDSWVIAMQDHVTQGSYGSDVRMVLEQDNLEEYLKAAELIEQSDVDLCILSHEFGIFGGRSGTYILTLLNAITIPVVTIVHTVLRDPDYHERHIMNGIISRSDEVVVMNRKAVSILKDHYSIDEHDISIIPHGTPDVDFRVLRDSARMALGVTEKTMLFTFGLLSSGKGIETVIKAMPAIVEKHPEIVYIVQGKTHPHVRSNEGERYRAALSQLVQNLHMQDHVIFIDSYLTDDRLFHSLAAADIYMLPYYNLEQITSGALSFALGAGICVFSTPNWHAQEVLTPERGVLFDPGDSSAVASRIIELLDSPDLLASYRDHAYQYGRTTTWKVVGKSYYELLQQVLQDHTNRSPTVPYDLSSLPAFNIMHLQALTDEVGIVQHASYHLPNYTFGYALDDNARALSLCCEIIDSPDTSAQQKLYASQLIPRYLSFIAEMQMDDGNFHGFLDAGRRVCNDEIQSEDTFGRTIRALSAVITSSLSRMNRDLAFFIFSRALPVCRLLETIRGMAHTILALLSYLNKKPDRDQIGILLLTMVERLVDNYHTYQEKLNRRGDSSWKWFEETLRYENGIIPEALITCSEYRSKVPFGRMTGGRNLFDEAHEIGYTTLSFLDSVLHRQNGFMIVGNDGWYPRGGTPAWFDQQPLDAASMVHLYGTAYRESRNPEFRDKMIESLSWFYGENILHLPLYDAERGGCHDGLEDNGVNMNMGAESTIVYLSAFLDVLSLIPK